MIQKQAIVFLALFRLAANAEIYSSVVADVTDGLIGHWKLDEMSYDGTAGEVVDSSEVTTNSFPDTTFGSPSGSGRGFDLLGTLVVDDGNDIWVGASTNIFMGSITNEFRNGINITEDAQ